MLSSQLHSPGRRSLIYWRMPPASLTPFGRLLKFASLFERWVRDRFASRTTEGLQLGLIHFFWFGFALLSEPLAGFILGRLIALVNHF